MLIACSPTVAAVPPTETDTGAACWKFAAPVAVGTAQSAALTSLSGLVASRHQPGVLFAHPDRSGALFFALDASGRILGQYTLGGASTDDLEDIAIGPGPESENTLYLGDIGDNAARSATGAGRDEIQVLRLREPDVPSSEDPAPLTITGWNSLRFNYPDRTHDAETLMVDPNTGNLFVVTREADGSAFVFTAPADTPSDTPTTLTLLAVLHVGASGANAGDIAPSGGAALLRTYEAAWLYERASDQTWQAAFAAPAMSLPVANEAQSEGATFGADGRSWLSSGEVTPIIYRAEILCP